jgi:tetratricopeptide (TPR) repeat protein
VIRGLVLVIAAFAAAGLPPSDDGPALARQAFQAAYSLDYPEALALARRAVAASPDNPRVHRTLGAILWLDIAFKRGAVTIDHYMSGVTRATALLPPPPADLDSECQRETTRAIELAEAAVRRSPGDLDAQYEVAAAYALRASYIASIQGRMSPAFGAARHAYDAAETVLDRDPSRSNAGVIVGLYRYVVSTLGLPSRLFAYMAGFGGDKEKGIALLEAAMKVDDGHVEAGVALLLIYTRESRHVDAMHLAERLATEFPRNRLFTFEAGFAATRAGLGAMADTILTRGLTALGADTRPRFPGELSQWLYVRGIARTEMGHFADARADLAAALAANPPVWAAGRIHVQTGRVADLQGQRTDALSHYREGRQLCEAAHDDGCVADANRLIDRPFVGKSAQDGRPGWNDSHPAVVEGR